MTLELDRESTSTDERAPGSSTTSASAESVSTIPESALVLIERARAAAELAERAWRPADPLLVGSGIAVACDLYRQCIHWTLAARREIVGEPSNLTGPGASPARRAPLGKLWDETDQALLARAARDAQSLPGLRAKLAEKSFVDYAELGSAQQGALVRELHELSKGLLEAFEPTQRRAERLWVRRVIRFGFAAAALLAVVVLTMQIRAWLEDRRDLALLRPWKASSSYPVGECTSPHQDCDGSVGYFFHTMQETNPWLVVDLGGQRRISSVVVVNRLDCCKERAAPLVVEVSNDGKTWREVARNQSVFEKWRASFPRVRTRFVRLMVPGFGILHLRSVKVLP